MAAKRLAERPKIRKVVLPFMQAYRDLQPEAPEFNGLITWRSIADYCRDLNFSSEYMEFMFDVVRTAQIELDAWEASTSR